MVLFTGLKTIVCNLCLVENILKMKLAMGYYYKFKSSRRINILVKSYCIFLSIILLMVPIFGLLYYKNSNNTIDIVTLSCLVLEHIIYTITCLYTRQSSIQRYCSGIKIIDTTLELKTPVKSSFMFFLYFHIIFQFLYIIPTLLSCPNQWILHISTCLLVIFNTMKFASAIITYNLFFERMMSIRESLNKHLNNFNKIYVVQKYLLSYKHLLNNLQENSKAVTFTYLVNLMVYFFKVTYYTYFVMDLVLNKKFDGLRAFLTLLENVFLCICLLMPAVMCELAKAEYEKIKIALACELLRCKDEQLRMSLYNGIEYLENRPPSITIYRLFPVDISLITNFIHVCTTYIIVLLQTVF